MIGREAVEEVFSRGHRAIYIFWHGRMLALAFAFRYQSVRVLISSHSDGEYIYRITSRIGFGAVRGSSRRGGKEAREKLIEVVKNGYDIAITPDGPRGPRHVLQPGTISLAQKTGFPVIPTTVTAKSFWRSSSWDGFIIPKPFTKIVIKHDKPIYVPLDLTENQFEEHRKKIELALLNVTEEIDCWFDSNSK